uniref:M-phase inducer phosphatase n=1 Tax=Crassostrea virginica TaxID=6565 RepID=A0A8B8E682_CRAVI|nr:M-phase inducer phosphatase 2-like [Crassostrea virginica]
MEKMKELSPFRLTELPFELDDLSLSPSDVYQLMTPKHVTRPQFVDEDSGLGMDSFDKRQRRDCKGSPLTKRRKHVTPSQKRIQKSLSFGECPTSKSPCTSDQSEVLQFMERVSLKEDLVGDGSASHSLPTIPGKHADLKSITPETVTDLLVGKYDDVIGSYQIIDCRYPYEYEGGHIKGAVNFYKEMDVETIMSSQGSHEAQAGKRHILIFYCEFSSERGPKMYRNIRKADRSLNQDQYPKLNFPEMYLIHNGYKSFFESQKIFCEPEDYKPMLHKAHAQDLRHFRAKSKSFTSGEKRKKASRLSF